jgi:hypothetical protein
MKRLLFLTGVAGFAISTLAAASYVPLSIAEVSAPAINCIFDPACTIVVDDTASAIPFPGWPADAPFFIQTRTYKGAPGSPAAGLYGYEYRVDLNHPEGMTGPAEGIFEVSLTFGPNVPMDFDGSGTLNDVYITTEGAVGDVAPAVVRNGNRILFDFAAETVDMLVAALYPGSSSFFVGLVSTQPPTAVTVDIDHDAADGFAFNGIPTESVSGRAPQTSLISIISSILTLVAEFPLHNWIGPNDAVRQAHRKVALNLLESAEDGAQNGKLEGAVEKLHLLLRKVDGQRHDWLMNDPNSGINAASLLYENLASALNVVAPDSTIPLRPPPPNQPPPDGPD